MAVEHVPFGIFYVVNLGLRVGKFLLGIGKLPFGVGLLGFIFGLTVGKLLFGIFELCAAVV